MTGYISYKGSIWDVGVDGLPGRRYMGYTKAEAVKQYRAEFRLVRRRIAWRDYTKPGMPQTLFEAVMAALR